jgi:hypothetical protein
MPLVASARWKKVLALTTLWQPNEKTKKLKAIEAKGLFIIAILGNRFIQKLFSAERLAVAPAK